jgi:hypothetical protein
VELIPQLLGQNVFVAALAAVVVGLIVGIIIGRYVWIQKNPKNERH